MTDLDDSRLKFSNQIAIVLMLRAFLLILYKLYFDGGDSHSAKSLMDDIRVEIKRINHLLWGDPPKD